MGYNRAGNSNSLFLPPGQLPERLQPCADGGVGGSCSRPGTSPKIDERSRQEGPKKASSGLEIARFRWLRFAQTFAQTHDFWVHFGSSQVTQVTKVGQHGENQETKKTLHLQGFLLALVTSGHRMSQVAEEGQEVTIKYLGKTYFLRMAGDTEGIKPDQPPK